MVAALSFSATLFKVKISKLYFWELALPVLLFSDFDFAMQSYSQEPRDQSCYHLTYKLLMTSDVFLTAWPTTYSILGSGKAE